MLSYQTNKNTSTGLMQSSTKKQESRWSARIYSRIQNIEKTGPELPQMNPAAYSMEWVGMQMVHKESLALIPVIGLKDHKYHEAKK
jgi:hypothetical protein